MRNFQIHGRRVPQLGEIAARVIARSVVAPALLLAEPPPAEPRFVSNGQVIREVSAEEFGR